MADSLAETVRILREAGARATFHRNGQLASLEFTSGMPAGAVTGAASGIPEGKEAIRDVILGDPPQLTLEAEDLPEGSGVDDESEDDTEPDTEGRPVETRDDTPIGPGETHEP